MIPFLQSESNLSQLNFGLDYEPSTYYYCPQVGDELLDINGNTTEGMPHSDAITIIKHGGDVVKLIVRRLPENTDGRPQYVHIASAALACLVHSYLLQKRGWAGIFLERAFI